MVIVIACMRQQTKRVCEGNAAHSPHRRVDVQDRCTPPPGMDQEASRSRTIATSYKSITYAAPIIPHPFQKPSAARKAAMRRFPFPSDFPPPGGLLITSISHAVSLENETNRGVNLVKMLALFQRILSALL